MGIQASLFKEFNRILHNALEQVSTNTAELTESIDSIGDMQVNVSAFMKAAGQEVRWLPVPADSISPETKKLRQALIAEEVKELLIAIDQDDLTEIADGIADVLYVVLGTAATYGIPSGVVFDEVHMSNMSKVQSDGSILKSEAGKILKPAHYQAPQLAAILKTMLEAQTKLPEEVNKAAKGLDSFVSKLTKQQLAFVTTQNKPV